MKKVLIILAAILAAYGLFSLGGYYKVDSSFKAKLDSLENINDSLMAENLKDDSTIAEYTNENLVLQYKVDHQKTRVKIIKEKVKEEQAKVDSFKPEEIVSYLNTRYPKDTISDLQLVAKPVLSSTVKDLIAYDGAKEEILAKDSIISINEAMLANKDSIITIFGNKEVRFKSIIANKDISIAEWSRQYDALELKHKKLQLRTKFQRIAASLVVGALAYTLLTK